MNTLSLLAGALTLKTTTFAWLRGRSDVFYRGLLVLLLVGLVDGAFEAGVLLAARVNPPNADQIAQQVIASMGQSGMVPTGYEAMVAGYVREAVLMGVEIGQLAPQAGAAFRPVALALDWLGTTLSAPLGALGWVLLAGLIIQLAARGLGGRAGIAQMLGLTALAAAPYLFKPVSTLLAQAGSGLGIVNGIVGWVLFIWSAAVLVKATAMAQGLSTGRALGAVLLALIIIVFLCVLLLIVSGIGVSVLVAVLANLFATGR